jgi:hypothetical protein
MQFAEPRDQSIEGASNGHVLAGRNLTARTVTLGVSLVLDHDVTDQRRWAPGGLIGRCRDLGPAQLAEDAIVGFERLLRLPLAQVGHLTVHGDFGLAGRFMK